MTARENQAAYRRRWRARLKEEGLCVWCRKPAVPYVQCFVCRIKQSARAFRQREREKATA